jgi:hypothetical protein
MKTIAILLILALPAFSDQFRTWTQLGTSKTIDAKIIDKDEKRVRLATKDSKTPWVNLLSLIADDRDYVEAWKKKPLGWQALKVGMTGNPSGGKTITVEANAWSQAVTVRVYQSLKNKSVKFTQDIQPYSCFKWTGLVGDDYRVCLVDTDGILITDQTSRRKD